MIAAKHMDIVLGVDIHINIVPPGAPTPIPHLLVGMIFDAFDYVPYIGQTVVINYFLAAQPMTEIVDLPPQFPMAGPFQMLPENKGEVMTGSMSVGSAAMTMAELGQLVVSLPGMIAGIPGAIADWLGGDEGGEGAAPEDAPVEPVGPQPVIPPPVSFPPMPAPEPIASMPTLVNPLSRLGDITLGCADIGSPAPEDESKKGGIKRLSVPMAAIIATPKGFPVLVGGPPSIAPLSAIAMRLGMKFGMKLLGKLMKKAATLFNHGLKKIFGDNPVSNRLCRWGLEPIDLASGKMSSEREDFSLPGPIPLIWKCIYYSNSSYKGPLGIGWHHSYDLSLSPEVHDGIPVLKLRMADGRITFLPQLEIGDTYFERQEKLDFFRDERGYVLKDREQLYYRFHEDRGERWPLARVEDLCNNAITFAYDELAGLKKIVDSAGRVLQVDTDIYGHLRAIHAPHPDEAGKTFPIVRYEFNIQDQLAAAVDALGHAFRYHYEGKLLTRLTYPHGLSFYYRYDGSDYGAKCIHSHGDGDLYNGNLTYEEGKTILERIVGQPDGSVEHFFETYFHDGAVVLREINALGHEKSFEYSENYDLLAIVDQLGQRTEYKYDDRGNRIAVKFPNNTLLKLTYSEEDLLIQAVDPIGGKWSWEYTPEKKLSKRENSLRQITSFSYDSKGLLKSIIDPLGGQSLFGYDTFGNIIQITAPDNASSRWKYNYLGRIIEIIEPQGSTHKRRYDLRGRAVWIKDPDGNETTLKYNSLGNVVQYQDNYRKVAFEYQGLGQLKKRQERDESIAFEYTTEEKLVGVTNEVGIKYTFELNAINEVEFESSFNEVKRYYQRDASGRLTSVMRSNGIESTFYYDAMGNILRIEHSNSETEIYTYREDGALLEAKNNYGKVVFERDLLGQVLSESQNGVTVRSTYNAFNQRINVCSSLGLDIDLVLNNMGDVMRINAKNASQSWVVDFKRDILGLELERLLPGGVTEKWERDLVGRPIKHLVFGGNGTAQHSREYFWGVKDRLKQYVDFGKEITQFQHDDFGNLVRTIHPDGQVDNRLVDAIGNLFKKVEKQDRKYSPGGQLIESEGVRFQYDGEGNLVKKTLSDGKAWHYEWSSFGMLTKVTRPDKKEVKFTYDNFGRRLTKSFEETITYWVWDGNVPIHEWTTTAPGLQLERETYETNLELFSDQDDDIYFIEKNDKLQRRAQMETIFLEEVITAPNIFETLAQAEGIPVSNNLVTWVFEPESFTPIAKLVGEKQFSIQSNHIGSPISMYDETGEKVWSAKINAYGELHNVTGEKMACPFRFPGQYEDTETGLYYNRFRYYDKENGIYISQDPMGLMSGEANLYAYVADPNCWVDVLGLVVNTQFTRGSQGEIKTASATVTRSDLNTGTGTNSSSIAQARNLGEPTDDAGHVIARRLGGSGGVDNVFPQSSAVNRGEFRVFEGRVADLVAKHGQVDISIRFKYRRGETRPHTIEYRATAPNGEVLEQKFRNPC